MKFYGRKTRFHNECWNRSRFGEILAVLYYQNLVKCSPVVTVHNYVSSTGKIARPLVCDASGPLSSQTPYLSLKFGEELAWVGKKERRGKANSYCRWNYCTFRENWYMGLMVLRSFMMKYSSEARAAAGR